MTKATITTNIVNKIAHLANLPINEQDTTKLQKELESIVEYINKIQSLDTTKVEETSQVTGLENVVREDVVKPSLTQEEALSNGPKKYKGYFVVKAIFEE